MNNADVEPAPRTTLVSIFGWVSLVGGILMALVVTLNVVMLSYLKRMNDGEILPAEDMAQIPSAALFYLDHMVLIGALSIAAALLMAVAGFGIIRRRDWGRKLGIYLLASSIVLAFASIPTSFMGQDGALSANERYFYAAISVVQALLSAALHGWLIWKLRTPAICGEFVEPRSESITR